MDGLLVEKAGGFPGIEVSLLMEYLVQHFMAMLRIGAFCLSAPFFGTRYFTTPIRIILAMALAYAVYQVTPIPGSELVGTPQGVLVIIKELFIGLSAGLIMTIWFSAASLAGEKIASSAGLGFAAQVDPDSGGQTPVVSQLLTLFLLVIFLSMDGHLLVISIMLKSYEISPVAYMPDMSIMIQTAIEAAGMMFFAAAMIMLPVITLLLMINISIGIITRSAPQLNLFSFGFPISMLGVFFILYISADVFGFAFTDLVEAALDSIERSIGGLAIG